MVGQIQLHLCGGAGFFGTALTDIMAVTGLTGLPTYGNNQFSSQLSYTIFVTTNVLAS